MAIFWFMTFVVLLVVELTTVNLVSIWFAIGAVCAMFVTFLSDSFLLV